METHIPDDINLFKQKALQWAASFETACYFDSNSYSDPYSAFDVLIAAGTTEEINKNSGTAFQTLNSFLKNNKDWVIGFLGYDLKNELEKLNSSKLDYLDFPELYFFKPLHLILIKQDKIQVLSPNLEKTIHEIGQIILDDSEFSFNGEIKSRFSAEDYKETVTKFKDHIRRGDIYEANFCQEFYSENSDLDPLKAFKTLNKISPTPFATFFKHKNKYIISATPERFLSKRKDKIISQPVKGTIKRSDNKLEDERLKNVLKQNKKEQSENVMIVDLVRNDLTKCAVPGSVKVEELFGIYSFEQVHQMISTIVCKANPALSIVEIIKSAFPMGSMTGAPKISAMKLIDKYERTKRGVFSGAIGYISPEGDFDFNVVIRTLLYNAQNRYLSFHVGSAITFASDAENEYEECLLKAEAIRQTLSSDKH